MSTPVTVEPGDAAPTIPDAAELVADAGDARLGGFAWWSSPQAPTMVLLHGWGQNAGYHADRARWLHGDGWNAVCFALRGWPGAGGDANDYGLSSEGDLRAMVDAVREHAQGPLYLFAYSAGGLIAARGLPGTDHVDGLITINAPMNVHTEYRDTKAQRMRDFYDSALTDEHWRSCSPVTVADRITIPMLVVAGSDDAMIPASQGQEICALVPSASYLEMPGMRHLPSDEQWKTIFEHALRWIDSGKDYR